MQCYVFDLSWAEREIVCMQKPYYYSPSSKQLNKILTRDLCVFGGTSGGIAAATAACRMGLSVVVVEPGKHIGGLSSGGLGFTDVGNKQAIGGIAREFYKRVGRHYGVDEHWRFEPHVAGQVFADWIREENVELYTESFLHRVERKDNRIIRLWTQNGLEVVARMFIDCSYEGDLMAATGVSCTYGREDNSTYGETLNGAQVRNKNQFDFPVDPYVEEKNPSSGLLPGIDPCVPVIGQGDKRIQAYNFRLCLTNSSDNQLPIREPEGYRREDYELLARYCRAGYIPEFGKFDALENSKVDMNNRGAFSTDYIGCNYRFPFATYAEREVIFQQHVLHTQGLLWFWKQDQAVDSSFQNPFQSWGWAADEFLDTGGFPPALYIREARRLVGDVVMTEHHCTGSDTAEDPIALAAYTMDSHNCRRFVDESGCVRNEGDVQVPCGPPYPISYRAVIPARGECTNLLVPFCLSASHIAFGSIRMEPVFMVLAESCVHAAYLALRGDRAVQDIPYEELNSSLLRAGQKLTDVPKAKDTQSGE